MTEISIPSFLNLTCTECETGGKAFMATDGSSEELYVVYTCQNCDNTVRLDLDP